MEKVPKQNDAFTNARERHNELIESLRARLEELVVKGSADDRQSDHSGDLFECSFQNNDAAFGVTYSKNPIGNEEHLFPGEQAEVVMTLGADKDFKTDIYSLWADGVVTKNFNHGNKDKRDDFQVGDAEIAELLSQLANVEPMDS